VDINLPTLMSERLRSFLATEPATDWARVTVPALGLFGAKDVQVPLGLNERAWREALAAAGNDDATAVVFPEANHLFQDSVTGSLDEYSELAAVFTADFLPTLVEWVTARAGVDG
jgi:pimeloyl-ACP methyl ester carboxylesterase